MDTLLTPVVTPLTTPAESPVTTPVDSLASSDAELLRPDSADIKPAEAVPVAHNEPAAQSTSVNLKVDEEEATFIINSLQVKNEHFTRKLKAIIGDRPADAIEMTIDDGKMIVSSLGEVLLECKATHLGNYGDYDNSAMVWCWNEATRLAHVAGPKPLAVSSNSFVSTTDKLVITYIMAVLAQDYDHIYQTGTDVIGVYGLNAL
jgi:hypothetical protein